MREVISALRFTGQAAPTGKTGAMLRAATRAPSRVLTSRVGPDGLCGTLAPAAGDDATFTAEVICTGETSFQERGAIVFGAGHRLRFTTVGSGDLGPSADPGRQHGTVMWRVDGGDGPSCRRDWADHVQLLRR